MTSNSKDLKTKRLYADPIKADNFKKICKANNIGSKEALDLVLDFIILNQINPDDLEYVWSKQTRIELREARNKLLETHNYTAGFLKTFEKNLIEKIDKNNSDNNNRYVSLMNAFKLILAKNEIEKTTIGEILYDIQLLIKLEDDTLGTKISKRNFEAIIAKEKSVKDSQ